LASRNQRANFSLTCRKNAKENSNYQRETYNYTVAKQHQQKAIEHARLREANEMRIK